MQCVPSTYHNCLKYIHNGVVHCIPEDNNPYSYCNITGIPDGITLPSAHFFMTPLSKSSEDNGKQNISKHEKQKEIIENLDISNLFSESNKVDPQDE